MAEGDVPRAVGALEAALRGLMPYRAHLRNCEVGDTEFCTCGLREAADAARAALARTTQEERP